MSRLATSRWSSFVAGACAATALAAGFGVLFDVAAASSPPAAPAAATPRESTGYATPDDAVAAYLEGLGNADLEAMMATFAIETYVANYDFAAYLELVQAYTPTGPVPLPATDPFNIAINTEARSAQVAGAILLQYRQLCCPQLDPVQTQPLTDAAAAADFVENLSSQATSDALTSIDSFSLVPLDEVDAEAYDRYASEQNQQNLARRAATLGADEIGDVAARFESIDGDVYALFSVVRYGDHWWIGELGGTFATLLDVSVTSGGILPVAEVSGG